MFKRVSGLRGKTATGYKDKHLELTRFLNVSHFPEYFRLVKTKHFLETTKKTLDDWPLYNSTFPVSALESYRMGQRKRGNQTLLLQTEVMNSWFSCEYLHKSSHCNGHSKDAGEPEATAPIS